MYNFKHYRYQFGAIDYVKQSGYPYNYDEFKICKLPPETVKFLLLLEGNKIIIKQLYNFRISDTKIDDEIRKNDNDEIIHMYNMYATAGIEYTIGDTLYFIFHSIRHTETRFYKNIRGKEIYILKK